MRQSYIVTTRLKKMVLSTLVVFGLLFGLSIQASENFNLESYDWQGAIPSKKVVRIINHYGSIRSRSNSDTKVFLHASYQEIGDSPLKPKFEISENSGELTIEVKYSQPIRNKKGELRGRTDLSVLFPPEVKVIADTTDGMIKIDKSGSQVEARSITGSIKLTTTGLFSVTTQSGPISIRLRGFSVFGESSAKSHSGKIKADIFNDMDLNLTAHSKGNMSLNGNNINENKIYRRQGNAQSKVDLDSTSGDIAINIIQPPKLVKSTKPTKTNIDLRTVPKSQPWKPGDKVEDINPKKDNDSQ